MAKQDMKLRQSCEGGDDPGTTILSKHSQTGWRPHNQKVVTAVFKVLVHKKSFPVLYKAAHRMLTPESQRGLGSPLGNEQHDFSLLSRWIVEARKVFRRKCKARKVRRSKV